MKALFVLLVAALFLIPATVLAQETETEPGDQLIAGDGDIGPDNWLYGFDVAFDHIALALTWDPEARARLGLKIAEERLLEAKSAAERGRPEAAAAAQAQFEIFTNATRAALEAIPEDLSNITAEHALRASVGIENELEDLQLKVAIVMDRVSTKVLAKAPEAAQAVLNTTFAKIKAHIDEIKIKIQDKKASIKLKLRAFENKTEQEIENETEEIEAEEGLTADRAARAEIIRERLETRLEKLTEQIEGLNISEQTKAQVLEKIEAIKERIEKIENRSLREILNVSQAASAFGQQVAELAHQLREGNITAQELVAITTAHSEAVTARIREVVAARIAKVKAETAQELPNVTEEAEVEVEYEVE